MGNKKNRAAEAPEQIGAAPAADALERHSAILAEEAKALGARIEARYYVPLAEEAGEGEDRDLEAAVGRELAALRDTARSLSRAHAAVTNTADELRARTRDSRRSVRRRWFALNPPANGAIDLEEKRKNHFAQGMNLYKVLLVLAAGSFAGVIVEMLWCYFQHGYFESRRGLVYGPFNLLYGAGAAVLTLALYKYRNRGYLWSFGGGFLVGSVLEYVCSWAQEMLLGSRSWDYSNMPLNLNGRICFAYSLFWGVLGVLWIKDLYPRMAKWILKLPDRLGRGLTWALTIFLIFDAVVSCVAVGRWSQRVAGQPAEGAFWELVDERFPDERMERIFANMEFGTPDGGGESPSTE